MEAKISMSEKTPILKFFISSSFGHFRVPYTNIFLKSYPIPPKPTIIGMIGAMLGWTQKDVIRNQDKICVSMSPIKIPKTFVDYIRYLKYQDGEIEPAPLRTEILINPKYYVYVSGEKSFINRLCNIIDNRDFMFPLYMGKNEFPIEDIKVIWLEEGSKSKFNDPTSIVFGKRIPVVHRFEGHEMPRYIPQMPYSLDENVKGIRKLSSTINALIFEFAAKIELEEVIEGWRVNGENIILV